MLTNKTRSTLNSTKTGTPKLTPIWSLFRECISKASVKYSTSESYYVIHNINLAIQNKKCRLKTVIKDEQFNKEEENLEKCYGQDECEPEIKELTEYYKYYTQTSILYQQNFFKLMHNHREKRKVVQYNKLKVLLNLSESSHQEPTHQPRNNITPNMSSSNILSQISLSSRPDNEQSIMVLRLRNKLEKQLGPNCHRTIQDLDRNYHFEKKKLETIPFVEYGLFKKTKISKKEKENYGPELKSNKSTFKNKRNNSCESLNSPNTKRVEFKNRQLNKKKHLSMDNISQLAKDIHPSKEPKAKLFGNWTKPNPPSKFQERLKDKSQYLRERVRQTEGDKFVQVKERILEVKDKIKREKEILKKKPTLSTNQSQIFKNSRKVAMTSTAEKIITRRAGKIQFWN